MRGVIILAIGALAVAIAVPSLYDRVEDFLLGRDATASAAPSAPPEAKDRSMTIAPGRDGRFNVEAEVGGNLAEFLIDPNASSTMLRASDAARLGISPAYSDYSARISTVNGIVRGAPVELDRVAVGALTVLNVQAIVVPDEVLRQSLLGRSFLARIRWMQRAEGLVLWQ